MTVREDAAWCQVEEWLSLPNVWTPEPAQRHQEILRSLMPEAGRAELVPDAHLAALAIRTWSGSSDHRSGLHAVQWSAVGKSYRGLDPNVAYSGDR